MYSMHPDLVAAFVKERQEDLRRAAGEARLRHDATKRHRQRHRRRR